MEVPDRTAKWLYFEEWHVQHVKVRHGSVQNLWWLCRLGTHYHARCSTLLLGGLPHHNKHLQCPGQEASQNKRSCTHFRELLFPASYRWLFIYKSDSIHNLNAFSSQNIPATSRGTRGNIRGSQQVDGRRLATDWPGDRMRPPGARCLDVFSRGDVVQALFRYTSPGTTCGNSKGDQHDRFS